MTNKEIWDHLVNKQLGNVTHLGSRKWENLMVKHEFHQFPRMDEINIPHWRIMPILGKSEEDIFWYRLSRGIFNVNLRLRSEESMDYLEERDLFHDVWGHLPILFDKEYSDYLIALGVFAQYHTSEEARRAVSNIYWFTSEFGLVREGFDFSGVGQTKAYGAGILSSSAEIQHAVLDDSNKAEYETDAEFEDWILSIAERKDYITDGFQDTYYVLRSWGDLSKIVSWLWNHYE